MEIFVTYVLPVLIFAAIGGISGVLLTVGSKLFFVKTDETVAQIIEALPGANCGACGKCVAVCPNHLIVIRPAELPYDVRCSSKDSGKDTRAICKNGCLGCHLCEKKCPSGAITVKDNHAVIAYEHCAGCGICAEVCPVKCITLISD